MYRYQLPKQELYICNDIGGIGDIVAQFPVINYILEKYPNVYITYWLASFAKTLARKSLPESEKLIIRDFSEKSHVKAGIPVKKFGGIPYTNLATHMTKQAYDIILNTQPDDVKYYNYLPIDTKGVYINRFNLPEKYVIVCTGYTAPVREMRPEVVNGVIDYVLSKGYTPVFLGREKTNEDSGSELFIKGNFSEKIQFEKGLNLINKTEMLEMVKIIKGAKCIVGLDNGLLHIAGTTDIPIVGAFSSVKSWHRLPYRNCIMGWNYYPIDLTTNELSCVHCQSNMTLTFNFNFVNCFYKDYKCLSLLTADKYIKELEKIL